MRSKESKVSSRMCKLSRLEKIKSYCCIGLFAAVEEPDDFGGIKINFTYFRDELVWYVSVPEEIVGGSNIIKNCPWCGTKLPRKPYLSSEN